MSGQHAVIAPSALSQIVQCPASIAMQKPFPDVDGPEAAEGEAVHWAAAEMLQGREPQINDAAPNGVRLSQEMLEGADEYYADIQSTLAPYGITPDQGATEVVVECKRIHAQCWGTPDYRIWVRQPDGRLTLYVWDLKYGYGAVEVYRNFQLIAYAVGAIDQAGVDEAQAQVDVVMRIVQPRANHRDGPVREWKINAVNLRFYIAQAAAAAKEALTDMPRTNVGPECRYCTARHACPTLMGAAASAMDVAGQAQPMVLSAQAVGTELRFLMRAQKLLAARIDGLMEQAKALAVQGKPIAHFRMEQSSGRLKWTKPAAEVITLGKMFGIDVSKPPDLITPTQAKAKGLMAELVDSMSERPRGAAELVPDDGNKARQIFSRSNA